MDQTLSIFRGAKEHVIDIIDALRKHSIQSYETTSTDKQHRTTGSKEPHARYLEKD